MFSFLLASVPRLRFRLSLHRLLQELSSDSVVRLDGALSEPPPSLVRWTIDSSFCIFDFPTLAMHFLDQIDRCFRETPRENGVAAQMRGHKILTVGTAKAISSVPEETQRTSKAWTEEYMNNRLATLSVFILGATLFVSSAQAQRRVAFASARAGRTGTAFSRGGGVRTTVVSLRRARRFSGDSAFAPYFFSDYDSEPGIAEAPPNPIVEQTAQPASPAPVPIPPGSLVLELQGDHWVRITNYGQSQTGGQSGQAESEQASNSPSAFRPSAPRLTTAAELPSELPRAVLVFRDGHKEEIGKYMIKGATVYTSADYWRSGSWTRKVQIVELDVPATLTLNQERGAKFSLPSGPNEVMIRP
jgi:hypothetical protein